MDNSIIIIVLLAALVAVVAYSLSWVLDTKPPVCNCDMITAKPPNPYYLARETHEVREIHCDHIFDENEVKRLVYMDFLDAKDIEGAMRKIVIENMISGLATMPEAFKIEFTKEQRGRSAQYTARGRFYIFVPKQ